MQGCYGDLASCQRAKIGTRIRDAGVRVTANPVIRPATRILTAHLYDGTVAADHYRAMGQIERLFEGTKDRQVSAPTPAELVALVDSLNSGTLNYSQRETVRALREGILSLAMLEEVRV